MDNNCTGMDKYSNMHRVYCAIGILFEYAYRANLKLSIDLAIVCRSTCLYGAYSNTVYRTTKVHFLCTAVCITA